MIITLLSLIALSVQGLELNHCEAKPETKRYIDFDFSSSFPKQAIFSFNYKCSTINGKVIVKAISTRIISNTRDEAYKLVCQGVLVKKTNWGYDFDEVMSFFIHDTDLIELKKTAFNNDISIDAQGSEYLLSKLKMTFLDVSKSYSVAGDSNTAYSPEFKNASLELIKIVQELPYETTTIDYYLNLLLELDGDFTSRVYSEQLVLSLVKIYARWRM